MKESLNGRPSDGRRKSESWDVEICLISGRIVTEQAVAAGQRQAVETALAKHAIRVDQIGGVAARPSV